MTSIEKAGVTLSVADGRFDLTAREGKLGWKAMALGLVTHNGEEWLGETEVTQDGDSLTLNGRYAASGLDEMVVFELKDDGALIVTRTVRNVHVEAATIYEPVIGRAHGEGGPVFQKAGLWTLRMAHVDNLRIERFPWCRPESPYWTTVPPEPTWFGNQESNPVPTMLLGQKDYAEVLVEGQLAQRVTRARWRLAAAPMGELLADYRFGWEVGGGGMLLGIGQTLHLEPTFYHIRTDTHIQNAWDGYFAEAVARNEFRSREKNILNTQAFYCSWNYGIFQNFDENTLLETARCMAQKLPHIPFFLIDGGWQNTEKFHSPCCGNFYLPEAEWVDKKRIPGGMKKLADDIRALGLRPSIWWTPSINLSSTLAREHPEWLAKDLDGTPHRIGRSGYLDVSLPAVREYLEMVWDVIFNRWGYEAMKMDFWCHAFESEHIRYQKGTCMENRTWLLSTLRGYIPDDGFLMTCVATAHGDFLLGEFAETYRCCIDVGAAAWHEHPMASCWIQPLLSIPGRETTLLNVDGLGVNQSLGDDENLHRLTYGFITMGSLEIDGRLEELEGHQIEWLRRLTEHIDRGYPVQCPDNEAFVGQPFPKVLYVDYPADSPTAKRGVAKHVAIFNWTDETQYIGATGEQLGLGGATEARDFWTDETVSIPAEGLCLRLPRRSAGLYEIPV